MSRQLPCAVKNKIWHHPSRPVRLPNISDFKGKHQYSTIENWKSFCHRWMHFIRGFQTCVKRRGSYWPLRLKKIRVKFRKLWTGKQELDGWAKLPVPKKIGSLAKKNLDPSTIPRFPNPQNPKFSFYFSNLFKKARLSKCDTVCVFSPFFLLVLRDMLSSV